MEKMPLVSVIIPSYNHKNFIRSSIDSVVSQKEGAFEIELVVIDDGSTDGSPAFLEKLLDTGNYDFKLVTKENEGLCPTLNRAVREHTTGEYIAVLASDDEWYSEKLCKQLMKLKDSPNSELCYANSVLLGDPQHKPLKSISLSGNVKHILTIMPFIPAGTIIFTRHLYETIGGFDETDLRLEDWDFLLRASHITRFCCVNEPLLRYRVHDESTIVKMKHNGELFREKYKVLHKNRKILNPFLFLLSTLLHFVSDNVIRRILLPRKNKQGYME